MPLNHERKAASMWQAQPSLSGAVPAAGLRYTRASAERQPAVDCGWSSANRRRRLSANVRRLSANVRRLRPSV